MTNEENENKDENASHIKFPCDFTIKVLGKNNDDFENKVLMIVHHHFPKFGNGSLQKRLSKGDNYLSLSITIHAENKAQLDAIYTELSAAPEVLMAL